MAYLHVDYSIHCTLGGAFDPFDELSTEDAARHAAFRRLRDEITQLVYQGGPEEWQAAFEIILDRVEPEEEE